MMPTESPAKKAPPRKRAVAALDTKRSPRQQAAVARRRTPDAQSTMPASPVVVEDLAVTAVRPDPKNVRKHGGDLTELTESIREQGVLEPILVTKSGKGWMIVCGERRYRAAKAAGRATVPCIVREFAPQARLEAQLTENLQRADLTPLEEARAYDRMLSFVTQRQLAGRVNRSQSHISKRLSLLKLPTKLHEQIDTGELAVGDALELAKLAAMDDGTKLVDEALRASRNGWNEWPDVVADVIRTAEERAKHDQAVTQLKADGVAVIPWPKGGWFGSKAKPIKSKTPASSRYRYSAEDLPLAAVKAGGHLAAAVDDTGEVLYVCTEPAKYRKKAETSSTTRLSEQEKADRARRRDENKQRRAAADDRLPYLRKVVAEGWGNEFVGLHLVDAIGRTSLDALRVACDILEITLDGKTDWQLGQAAHDALYDRAIAQPTRVGMAIALATTDHHLRREYFTEQTILDTDIVGAAAARLFYGYLARNGYEPATPWELNLVSGIKGFGRKSS